MYQYISSISRADALDVACFLFLSCFLFQSFYFIFLLQSDDVQRAGRNLYRSTILLCSHVVFYRIDVGRIVDGVLLQTILGRKANELAILDLLALKIDLRCGVLGAGVGNLQDYLASLLILRCF